MQIVNGSQLEIDRCPHCGIANPLYSACARFGTETATKDTRVWLCFGCSTCGGVVTVNTLPNGIIQEMFPKTTVIDEAIENPAREYLSQALATMHAPAGCIMLSASAVDAMLKAKGYRKGDLYSRINDAAANHLITQEMSLWAHEVRLDANDQRHADEFAPLPTYEEAKRSVEFVLALGEFLFVLPSRVNRGLANAGRLEKEPEDHDVV